MSQNKYTSTVVDLIQSANFDFKVNHFDYQSADVRSLVGFEWLNFNLVQTTN